MDDKIYKLAFNGAHHGILFIKDGRIVDCNQFVLNLFEIKNKEEIVGKSLLELFGVNQTENSFLAQKIEHLQEKALSEGYTISEICFKRNKSEVCVELSLKRLEIEEQTFIIVSLTDVTKQKRLQKERLRLRQFETIGTMAGGIAHEFNNILNAVMGSCEILYTKISEPKLKHWLEIIMSQSQKGANLVKQLLEFSRMEHIEAHPLDVKPLIKETVKMLKDMLPENIELIFNYENQEEYWTRVSPSDLQEILLHLTSNARDAMPQGGQLKIELGKKTDTETEVPPGEYVLLSVKDTGIGMSEEVLERCLEPFFTTKTQTLASGMGLTYVYSLVKQNKGYLLINSQEGKGTEVTIYFPLFKRPNSKIFEPKACQTNIKGVILLVEDDTAVLEILKSILEGSGFKVFTASNGKEALELYKTKWPEISLVVSDIVMPQLDGLSFYKEAQKINPDIKVLFITGYNIKQFVQPNQKIDLLAKPIRSCTLLKKINDLLKNE